MTTAAPGTYILITRLDNPQEIVVGRLGEYCFLAGYYLYVGSALGPGGLAARIGRHLRRSGKAQRWHVDYLLTRAQIEEVWVAEGKVRAECHWAEALRKAEGAILPVDGFGASDCACPTHLIYFPNQHRIRHLTDRLLQATPEPMAIQAVTICPGIGSIV